MPIGLRRIFGVPHESPSSERQLSSLRILHAFLRQKSPRRRYVLVTRLLRQGLWPLAIVAEAGSDERDRFAARILCGGATGVDPTLLADTLNSRISPLHGIGPDAPRWMALHEDPFGPGTAFLRKFNLSSAVTFSLGEAGGTAAGSFAPYLVAATPEPLTFSSPVVQELVTAWSMWRLVNSTAWRGGGRRSDRSTPDGWPGPEALRYAPVGLAVVAGDRVRLVNDKAADLLRSGVSTDDQAWRTWLLAAVRRLETAGREREMLVASQTRQRTFEVAIGQQLDDGGSRLLVIRDATAEATADSRRAETIRTLSHELRTPLTSMKNSVGLLMRGDAGELSQAQRRFMAMTMRNIDRLERLIGDLLDVSSAAAGKLPLRRRLVDLGALLHETIEMLAATARQKKIHLDVSGLPQSFNAHVDGDKIVQMIHNTVGNALKYTEEGGRVRIGLKERPLNLPELTRVIADRFFLPLKVFAVVIEDNGMGMSEDVLHNLFHPFRRGREAKDSLTPGSGLGLHITRALVEAHGGNIEIKSSPDVGTQVAIMLPRDHESERVLVASRRLARIIAGAQATAYLAFLDARRPDLELMEKDLNKAHKVLHDFLERVGTGPDVPVLPPASQHNGLLSMGEVGKASELDPQELTPGLWGAIVADRSRLDTAWAVERVKPGAPAFLAETAWQTMEIPYEPEGSDTPTTAEFILPKTEGKRAPETEED